MSTGESRFDMAKALLKDAKKRMKKAKTAYEKSLKAKSISADLKIEIKAVLENTRSALDYCARELCDRCSKPTKRNVYFPITPRGFNATDFKSLVGKNIPGLPGARPDLVELLASFQEFTNPDNGWLPDLATLCNENKHEQLTPQTRREVPEMRIESGGVGIRMTGGASISMGRGTSIRMGNMLIPGGQVLQPGGPVCAYGKGSVKNVVWVSFDFDTIGKPVVPFLQRCVDGVARIVSKLEKTVRQAGG